ncbi:MAG: extracellular solute-binding protein [Clostridia bacterium]|nr:extracellular solute-binding protein [Clostridia bacterium]
MKTNKLTKIIVLASASALLAGSFAGCGGKKEKEVASTDGKNFTYWTTMQGESAVSLKSYNEMMMWQELEKRTGVHIDFIHPIEGSTGNEAFIAMMSGSERPDMIEYDWSAYTGGAQQALEDEVLIALDDYIEEYAPNYYDYMEGEKGKAANYRYKLMATSEEGQYYGFNVLNVGDAKAFAGLYVRGDKLEEWGMERPETIDEWTALFAKAKSEGFEKPLTGSIDAFSFKSARTHSFNTAFNVGKDFYLEDGKVVFGPFQPGFKEYVAQLAEWTKAGYLDTGFVTNDSVKIEGNIANDISIASWGFIGSAMGKITPAARAKNPDFSLVACPAPVAKKGEISKFQMRYNEATTLALGITPECGNKEAAISWYDYFYGEEGMILQIFGIEGDTFTKEEIDGETHYVYTDKITKHEGLNSITDALYKYMLPCNHPGYNQHEDYLNGYYQYEEQKDALKVWNRASEIAADVVLPTLSYTEEELEVNTNVKEIALPALEVAICDMILGKRSMDTWDDAIAEAKANGYDDYLENVQTAYDRFMAKIK